MGEGVAVGRFVAVGGIVAVAWGVKLGRIVVAVNVGKGVGLGVARERHPTKKSKASHPAQCLLVNFIIVLYLNSADDQIKCRIDRDRL